MKDKQKIAEQIVGDISWDNWELEECDEGYDPKETKHYTTNQVLLNKIEWAKESICDLKDNEETLDILSNLELVLGLVDIDLIAKNKKL